MGESKEERLARLRQETLKALQGDNPDVKSAANAARRHRQVLEEPDDENDD